MKILLYSHHIKNEDIPWIKKLTSKGTSTGIEFTVNSTLYKAGIQPDGSYPVVDDYETLMKHKPDIALTLGGDGTILRILHLIRDSGVPIMGINLGRLGFLSGVEKSRIEEAIEGIANKEYRVESRSLIELSSEQALFGDMPFALNDFTLSKRDTSSMITIHTYVNGEFLNSYWADGLIVATPTGSTGYSLSCGGPILFPGCNNFVITPIAPHNLNVRPLVIDDDVEISFEIEGRAAKYLCTLDSRYETISRNHRIYIKRAGFNVNLAYPFGIEFMGTIRDKLMWGLDKRN
jgi:NAD+ kinase